VEHAPFSDWEGKKGISRKTGGERAIKKPAVLLAVGKLLSGELLFHLLLFLRLFHFFSFAILTDTTRISFLAAST
jgi:hypothetical protein